MKVLKNLLSILLVGLVLFYAEIVLGVLFNEITYYAPNEFWCITTIMAVLLGLVILINAINNWRKN